MSRMLAVVLVLLGLATEASAQDQWGLDISVTPSWQTGTPARYLFQADRIDLTGSEVTFGFVRGELLGGDWGMSFVNKAIAKNSTLDVDVSPCGRGTCGTFYRTISRTRMTGLEFHQFLPYKTWRGRAQLGMVGSVGVAWLRGTLYKRTVTEESDVESFQAAADELYPPSQAIVPLLSMEIAGSGVVTNGIKVRASGGFSMPGYHTFRVTVIYLFPNR